MARFCNLVYYRRVEGFQPDRDKKGKVTKSVAQKIQEFDRLLLRAAPRSTTPGRRSGPPAWWKDDADAAQSSIMAARQMGVKV